MLTKRIGQLRHRVTLQRCTESQSAVGIVTKTWYDIVTLWASVEPLGGREYFTAQQVNAEVTHTVTLRPYSGITIGPKDRFKFGTRTLNVERVINIEERGIELQALCREEL